MIHVDIKPSTQRFGRLRKRKQWSYTITGRNGEPLDPRDTYANVSDIEKLIDLLRHDDIVIRTHYADGVKITTLPGRPF